jgi:hypothetical protein
MPGQPQYSLQPATRTSAAAITSLICGIIGLCFGLAALIGIITGIVGIVATKNPTVKGRGMAIAGLVLGLIALVGWSIFVAVEATSMFRVAPATSASAAQFMSDLSAGSIDAAQAESSVPRSTLESASATLTSWGASTNTKVVAIHAPFSPAGTATIIDVLTFPTGQHTVTLQLVDDNGTAKVNSVLLQ